MPQLIADWSFTSLKNLSYADYDRVATSCNKKAGPRKRFLDLPAEIRNQIYRYVMGPNLPPRSPIPPNAWDAWDWTPYSTNFDMDIMFTCRQTYHEVSNIFYQDHLLIRVEMHPWTNSFNWFHPWSYCLSWFMELGLSRLRYFNAKIYPRMLASILIRWSDGCVGWNTQDLVLTYQELFMLIISLRHIQAKISETFNSQAMVVKVAIQKESNFDDTSSKERLLSLCGARLLLRRARHIPPLIQAVDRYFSSLCHFRAKDYRAFYYSILEVKKNEHDNGRELDITEISKILPAHIFNIPEHVYLNDVIF